MKWSKIIRRRVIITSAIYLIPWFKVLFVIAIFVLFYNQIFTMRRIRNMLLLVNGRHRKEVIRKIVDPVWYLTSISTMPVTLFSFIFFLSANAIKCIMFCAFFINEKFTERTSCACATLCTFLLYILNEQPLRKKQYNF